MPDEMRMCPCGREFSRKDNWRKKYCSVKCGKFYRQRQHRDEWKRRNPLQCQLCAFDIDPRDWKDIRTKYHPACRKKVLEARDQLRYFRRCVANGRTPARARPRIPRTPDYYDQRNLAWLEFLRTNDRDQMA